jgi:uncharacterized membrane protein YbjE (DUF340 family)
MLQLIGLILALIGGYLANRLPFSDAIASRILFFIVVLILFVMGYEFGATVTNLFLELLHIGSKAVIFAGLILLTNLAISAWLLRAANHKFRTAKAVSQHANYWLFAKESGKYIVIIAAGVAAGYWFKHPLTKLEYLVTALLLLLLFIIGHQMRVSGIVLRQVLFNKLGSVLALIVMASSLLAGLIGAWLLGMPLKHGLMLCSGFGWYTLASILNGQLINQDFGTLAFFIDFSRELLAIILLPSLGRRFPLSLVGYCGATAMDFSLPIIKQNLAEGCIQVAIASGMLLSLLVPLLIPIFARL